MTSPISAFGNYRLVEKIGDGPMSEVIRAQLSRYLGDISYELSSDFPIEHSFILKRIHPPMAREPSFARRFLQGAGRARRLMHPHLLRVVDHGEYQGILYVVSESRSGHTLNQFLAHLRQHGRPLPPFMANLLMLQLCEALQVAHRARADLTTPWPMTHGGVKPSNILIDRDGFVTLLDLGTSLSCGLDPEISLSWFSKDAVRFLAPEQVLGDDADARSDVYSLGVLFFELLTLSPVIQPAGPLLMLEQIRDLDITERFKSVPAHLLDPELVQVLEKALQRRPVHRFSDAGEMADALSELTLSGQQSPRTFWNTLTASLKGEEPTSRIEAVNLQLLVGSDPDSNEPWDLNWYDDAFCTDVSRRLLPPAAHDDPLTDETLHASEGAPQFESGVMLIEDDEITEEEIVWTDVSTGRFAAGDTHRATDSSEDTLILAPASDRMSDLDTSGMDLDGEIAPAAPLELRAEELENTGEIPEEYRSEFEADDEEGSDTSLNSIGLGQVLKDQDFADLEMALARLAQHGPSAEERSDGGAELPVEDVETTEDDGDGEAVEAFADDEGIEDDSADKVKAEADAETFGRRVLLRHRLDAQTEQFMTTRMPDNAAILEQEEAADEFAIEAGESDDEEETTEARLEIPTESAPLSSKSLSGAVEETPAKTPALGLEMPQSAESTEFATFSERDVTGRGHVDGNESDREDFDHEDPDRVVSVLAGPVSVRSETSGEMHDKAVPEQEQEVPVPAKSAKGRVKRRSSGEPTKQKRGKAKQKTKVPDPILATSEAVSLLDHLPNAVASSVAETKTASGSSSRVAIDDLSDISEHSLSGLFPGLEYGETDATDGEVIETLTAEFDIRFAAMSGLDDDDESTDSYESAADLDTPVEIEAASVSDIPFLETERLNLVDVSRDNARREVIPADLQRTLDDTLVFRDVDGTHVTPEADLVLEALEGDEPDEDSVDAMPDDTQPDIPLTGVGSAGRDPSDTGTFTRSDSQRSARGKESSPSDWSSVVTPAGGVLADSSWPPHPEASMERPKPDGARAPENRAAGWFRRVTQRPELPEGALLQERYRIERLLIEFSDKTYYEVLVEENDSTRICYTCGYANNLIDDTICYKCKSPLVKQRLTLSMRWDMRRIEHDLLLSRKEIEHPGIARIYDQFVEQTMLFRVLDLVTDKVSAGMLLAQIAGPLDPMTLGEIGVQAAAALQALHDRSISCPLMSEEHIYLKENRVQLYDFDVEDVRFDGPLPLSVRVKDVMALARALIQYLPHETSSLVNILRDAAEGRVASAEDLMRGIETVVRKAPRLLTFS